jgi:hypothetical protein
MPVYLYLGVGKPWIEQKTYTRALQNPSETQINHVREDLSTVLNRNRKTFEDNFLTFCLMSKTITHPPQRMKSLHQEILAFIQLLLCSKSHRIHHARPSSIRHLRSLLARAYWHLLIRFTGVHLTGPGFTYHAWLS